MLLRKRNDSKLITDMKAICAAVMKNEFLPVVSTIAAEMGVKAYFVGGGLRDMLMGREIRDLDFALDSQPDKLPEIFADRIDGTFFWLNEQRLQARVVKKNEKKLMTFDFAPLRGSDIAQDLSLRDFTINAFALPLTGEDTSIIDPLNGINDLQQGFIKACSDDSFDDDPLRLLRAFRFAAIPGFSIVPETWRKICDKTLLLKRVAPERIRAELFQILDAPDASEILDKLNESGLLYELIPIFYVPEVDVLPTVEHRIKNIIEVEKTMAELELCFPNAAEYMHDYLGHEVESGVTMRALVKLAVFLSGYTAGASVSETAEKFRLGCKARKVLEILSLKAGQTSLLPAWKPTERAMFRFFRDSEPAGPGALIIAFAQKLLPCELCADMAKFHFTVYPNVREDTFLSGEEIMAILGTGPGRQVGEAVKFLRDAESAGLVNSKAEAFDYIHKNLLTKDRTVI